MKARFNPERTHVHKGKVKVGIELYPDPGTPLYDLHYVDHPDREYKPEELEDTDEARALRASVPTHKELNPCLVHFLTADPEIPPDDLKKLIRQTFDGNTLRVLEDALCREDGRRTVHLTMQSKKGKGRRLRTPLDIEGFNARLSSIEVQTL